jgi:DNA-binding IclR family transcriptional regulator
MPRESRSAKVVRSGLDDRRHIQSINVGFKIIQNLVDAPSSLSLRELADATGMATSQVYLYLVSFMQVGFVVQEGATNRYDLGPFALETGLAALRKTDVIEIAKPAMIEIQRKTGESVFLAVWGNRGPCIVSKVDGERRSPMHLRVGYVQQLLGTATGRIFLSYLPRTETADVLKVERETPDLRHAFPAHALEELIARTQAAGIANSDNLRHQGFASLSVPILDHSKSIRAAMTVIGPMGDFEADENGTLAIILKDAGKSISYDLGYRAAS